MYFSYKRIRKKLFNKQEFMCAIFMNEWYGKVRMWYKLDEVFLDCSMYRIINPLALKMPKNLFLHLIS